MGFADFQTFYEEWVKYLIALCGLQILFFAPRVFIFIIGGTCGMGKDGHGTSIQFSVQN
jgi:hypothetical protein